MKNQYAAHRTSISNSCSRMAYEDASSMARINRGLCIEASEMSYGEALKRRWSKIVTGFSHS